MIELVKVEKIEALSGYRLRLFFSNGRQGIHDFADLVQSSGPMIEPLKDATLFQKAFVSFGVPTWPNGFDVDAIALYREMDAAGELSSATEAA